MGCCSSSNQQASNNSPSSPPPATSSATPSKERSLKKSVTDESLKENQIAIAFKAKRGNVFHESMDPSERRGFAPKNIPKTAKQEQIIRTALASNFVFDSIDESDVKLLIKAMEIVDVPQGENIINQGETKCDYFYIIEKGSFTVIVDKKEVATLNEGTGFGELALVYNTPRQATCKAATNSTVFALDRKTFKIVMTNGFESKHNTILDSLKRFRLLSNLTPEQLDKLADTVEIVHYQAGNVIIRKGTEGSIFYMIKDGEVIVDDVGEKFKAHALGPGGYFGERALMTNEPRAATITAKTDCTLLTLDKEAFHKLLGPLQEVLDYNLNMRVLSSVTLFGKLTNQEKAKLCKSFQAEQFTKDSIIIKQGEKGTKFYVLTEGICKVIANDVEVTELHAGDYFGEMALLDDEVRKATVVCKTDCKCFNVDRNTFNRILGSLQHVMARETNKRVQALNAAASSSDLKIIGSGKGGGESGKSEFRKSDGSGRDGGGLTNYQLSDLKKLAVLGSGTFGKVTLVQHQSNKKVYALKAMLKSEIVANKQQSNVMNEKNIMISCDHPFILKLHQTFKDPRKLYMLLEFVQGGELFSVIHKENHDGVPDPSAKFYAAGVLLAVAYLHSKNIAYRDMKPENCLIDKNGYPKVVDFGFAKEITNRSFTLCGTPEYLAPELVLGRGHNKAVDYWALGVLIYEMQEGVSPFADPSGNMDQGVICRNIVNGHHKYSRSFNASCKDLCRKLLTKEIHQRLGNLKNGPEDIKNHAWFRDFSFEEFVSKQMPAPWVPQVRGITDTSMFDPYDTEDHPETGYIDRGNWDRDF